MPTTEGNRCRHCCSRAIWASLALPTSYLMSSGRSTGSACFGIGSGIRAGHVHAAGPGLQHGRGWRVRLELHHGLLLAERLVELGAAAGGRTQRHDGRRDRQDPCRVR